MSRLLLLLIAASLQGAITDVSVTTTPTQAILRYTAPSGSACTVDIAGVNDLDPSLFSGSNLDSRAGNPSVGQARVFVIGKRMAETATDGMRYSRALQAHTSYSALITCDGQTAVRAFATANIPVGDTFNEGPPVDRAVPGAYAYPSASWTTPTAPMIDPLTGVRSYRATSPVGTASDAQAFQTALDPDSAWANDAGPLTSGGGAATITGSVSKLLLRADDLTLAGGATYTVDGGGVSLDWVTVVFAASSIDNGLCAGDACKAVVCLTVDGVACATGNKEITLTATPSTYTVGTTTLMDLWQASGGPGIARPDASKATGTVNYVSSTKVVTWASGHKFSTRWGAGSRIVIGGTEYPIASVQSELSLTLASGPGNLTGSAYSANNFGVLVWKKTTAADQVSIGHATFVYGSSPIPYWGSTPVENCSAAIVTVGVVDGYNCFIDRELYWVGVDGSALVDLGFVGMSWWGDGRWSTSAICGTSQSFSSFDPANGDVWYCLISANSTDDGVRRQSIIKATYHGDHTARTNGLQLPDCGLNGAVQPCVEFIRMTPLSTDSVEVAGPAFNPDFAASGYTVDTTQLVYDAATFFIWNGVSPDGYLMIGTRELTGQDSKGWQFLWTLGDRTPAGTNGNSLRPVAAASSYRKYPLRWCAVHTSGPPTGDGWQPWGCNPFYLHGAGANYALNLTSTALNATVDAAGGLNTCPSNPFGITGKNCTAIEVTGEPARVSDSAYLMDVTAGDVIIAAELSGGWPIYSTTEYLRVLTKADAQHLVVQRAYLETAKVHSTGSLIMGCGIRSPREIHNAFWDYTTDPYGANASGSTILIDNGGVGGHTGIGPGVRVESVGTPYRLGEGVCPAASLGSDGVCYQVRRGTFPGILTAASLGVAVNPPFAGQLGVGNPNQVDAHPGPCNASWCLDGRPMDGGSGGGMLGSSSTPWTNTSGQLWKLAGGASGLHPKALGTMAYVGRSPLVDVSGPASVIPTDATGAYQYCSALAAGECANGSAVADIYVNAPFVSVPYCAYPGIAIQGDDTNSICVGSLGPYTGNVVQMGVTAQDVTGAHSRRLGAMFSRWNQQYVYWSALFAPSGLLAFSQTRWLDGVRSEDMISILPPYPSSTDSLTRSSFIPVNVTFAPVAGVTNVLVEFGYSENGDYDHFYCTSRQEACVAVGATVNEATPFYWESETFSGLSCASGCTVAIPTLPQRVTYFRAISRLGTDVVATGELQAISTEVAVSVPATGGIRGLNIHGFISIH